MKALVLSADGVEDSESSYPLYRLKEEQFTVDLAGLKAGTITCKHGVTFDANIAFSDIEEDQCDLLVLPSGKGPEAVRLNPQAISVTRKMFESGTPVARICHGIPVPNSAGVPKGRKAACWPGVKDDLKVAGGVFQDQEAVVDANFVSSRYVDDLPDCCREMMKMAGGAFLAPAGLRRAARTHRI